MKTKEELNALKEEVETVSKKLAELSEDEMAQVTGGMLDPFLPVTTLHASAYSGMFEGVQGLQHAPKLPATSLSLDEYKPVSLSDISNNESNQ